MFQTSNGGYSWSQVFKIVAADGGENTKFGVSVFVFGNVAAIGSFFDSNRGNLTALMKSEMTTSYFIIMLQDRLIFLKHPTMV